MTKRPTERRNLGRGLSALMADIDVSTTAAGGERSRAEGLREIPIEHIRPNPEQPRRTFASEALEELAASIREKGVLQPLILRPDPTTPGHYQIVAGERRWRAAQMARVHSVPAVLRDLNDTEVLEIAIVENIQRADLNPLEEALGYRQLMDRFGRTQEAMAQALGKSRSHIANLLRLLGLPAEVQDHLREGRLSSGHARALITAENPSELARRVIRDGLSVRALEALLRKEKGPRKPPRQPRYMIPGSDADTRAIETDLSEQMGLPVRIDHVAGTQSGRVIVRYDSLEQLDALIAALSLRTRRFLPD
ncbi:MAG: chromosome partitioning protein ParB [Alphaproteobacteria bacterium HGW-Alphaproteobacteria-2]|nr:MAG: chromosome partitioning protein ParB [Alphaproteobacteria bacterium HGW-Alphaproteobacteria-2]